MQDSSDSSLQQTASRIEADLAELFIVQDVTLGIPGRREVIRLRGYLQMPSHRAHPQIAERVRGMGYTAVLRRDAKLQMDELLLVPGAVQQEERPRVWVNAVLFGATILTTLYVGAGMVENRPPDDLWWPLFHFWQGWPFSLSLLSILVAHELGHYFTGRFHGVPRSLPYFIPLPVPDFLGNVLGTMGAVIFMKAQHPNRRVMLDIGAAGPLIGLVVAIPVILLGLSMSAIQPLPLDQPYLMEGNSLLYLLLKFAVFGRWLPSGGVDVFIHPVAFAGWAGLLVTSLNLIPAGQLDGGHVLYSLFGDRARRLTWPIILTLLALGVFVWQGWLLWAFMVFLFGQRHPGPLDSTTGLDTRRKVVAVAVLLTFVLTFTPLPLATVLPSGAQEVKGQSMLLLAGVLAGMGWLRAFLASGGRHRS